MWTSCIIFRPTRLNHAWSFNTMGGFIGSFAPPPKKNKRWLFLAFAGLMRSDRPPPSWLTLPVLLSPSKYVRTIIGRWGEYSPGHGGLVEVREAAGPPQVHVLLTTLRLWTAFNCRFWIATSSDSASSSVLLGWIENKTMLNVEQKGIQNYANQPLWIERSKSYYCVS